MHAQYAIMHAQLAIVHTQYVQHQHSVHHGCSTCYFPCTICPTTTCLPSIQYGGTVEVSTQLCSHVLH